MIVLSGCAMVQVNQTGELLKIPDRIPIVELQNILTPLAHQQNQLVGGEAPLAIEPTFFAAKLLAATQRTLRQMWVLGPFLLL